MTKAAPTPEVRRRHVEYRSLDELRPADRNPKRHVEADIRASLERFGMAELILRDDRTGKLVAGHGRLDGLRVLKDTGHDAPEGVEVDNGDWLVPVVEGWASKDDQEAEAYLIASNQTTIAGGWDKVGLLAILEEVEREVEGLRGLGFGADDLAELRRAVEGSARSGLTDDDAVPGVPEGPPVSAQGDVWLLGDNGRLVCGDCRSADAVELACGGRKIDLVFTDPPYGVSYVGGGGKTIQNDDLAAEELAMFLEGAFAAVAKQCRPAAVWYVCGPGGPLGHVFGSVLGAMGIWRQTIIWVKDRFVLGRSDFHYRHENLYSGASPEADEDLEEYVDIRFGWLPGHRHRRPKDRRQDTVWEVPRPAASREHPTMKPVELVRKAIESSSAPKELVFDAFTGSGSTLIAAWSTDRAFAGIELDEIYCDVICRRFEEHTGIVPVLEGSGPRSFVPGG